MIKTKEKFSEKKKISHPHDRLVKKILSNPTTTKDILELYLPKEVLAVIDLNQLSLQRDSFIDDEHRAFAVDVLYKTSFQNEDGYVWILLEHQSTDDPWLPVRIFKYVGIIWEHLRKTSKSHSVPLIYPMIIYNGNRPYSSKLSLKEMIHPEASQKIFDALFQSPLCLIDLTSIEDDVLRKQAQEHVKGIALLMSLKHVFDKNLQAYFDQILLDLFKKMDRRGDRDDVADMLYYLLNEGDFLDEDKFWYTLHQEFSPETEEKVMTIAQKLEARGREKGKVEGKFEAQLEIAETLLAEGLEPDLIAKATKLSLTKIKELQKKSSH